MVKTESLLPRLLLSVIAFSVAPWAHAEPAQVLIVRHAEKPSEGDDLSKKGVARAQALVSYFESTPAVTEFGTPVAIYAKAITGQNSSARPIETVTPLANSLGLTIQAQYSREEIAQMTNDIKTNRAYEGRMVLICWEHDVIPDIAQAFGVTNAPDKWDDSDFYDVWEIDFSGSEVSSFQVFSQHLMPNDP